MKPGEAKRWILLIEDDEEMVKVLQMGLSLAEYSVIAVGSALDAIYKLKNQKFHCILLDMRLQDESGERVIEFLHRTQKALNHDTPILVISGHLTQELISRIGKEIAGALVKPFEQQELLRKIQQVSASY